MEAQPERSAPASEPLSKNRNLGLPVNLKRVRLADSSGAIGGSKDLNPEPADDVGAERGLVGVSSRLHRQRLLEYKADSGRGEPPAPCCDWLLDQDLIPDLLMVWEACMVRFEKMTVDQSAALIIK